MNPRKAHVWFAMTLGAFSLAGCATVYEGKYEFSEGWRAATVVSVVTGAEIKDPGFWTCLRHVPEAERLSRTYVLLDYRNGSRHRKHMVPAPAGIQVVPGEKLYLNLSTCEQSLAKRTTPGQG